jgi:hypothetical protein
MSKSYPLLLLVATLCLVITILAAFWIGLMPQRLLANLSRQLKMEQGVILEASSPRMGFDGGPILKLQKISISRDGGLELTARDMTIGFGYSAAFGSKPSPTRVSLGAPVITLDLDKATWSTPLVAPEIEIHDAVVRLKDARHASSLAFSDVNGKLTVTDSVKLDLSFLQNGNLTTLNADVESTERLANTGSPADITLASREKILSFSGRTKFNQGLTLDGQMTLEGSETQTLLAWLGMPLQLLRGAGEIKLTSGLSTDGLAATLPTITAQIGARDFAGSAALQAGTDRVAITADITMPSLAVLPVTNLLAAPWSETPIALTDLTAVDANIHIKTPSLNLRQQNWGSSDITLNQKAGTAELVLTAQATTLNLRAASLANRLTLDLDIKAKSAEAKTLLGGLLGFDSLTGPLDFSTKVTATGNSLAALVSTLTGRITANSPKLSVASIAIADHLTSPGEGWQIGKGSTSTMGLTIDAELSDGIATLTRGELTFPTAITKLKGEIDLLRQAFDLQPSPKSKVQSISRQWSKPLFAAEAGVAPTLRSVTAPAN